MGTPPLRRRSIASTAVFTGQSASDLECRRDLKPADVGRPQSHDDGSL